MNTGYPAATRPTRSSPSGRTASAAARITQPISPTTDRRDRRGGFTLIELTLALAIISLIAAIALPRVYPGGGATAARAAVYGAGAILRADRNAALAEGRSVTTVIDEKGRSVVSGSGRGSVKLPADLAVSALGMDGGAVTFSPDGRSSGGVLMLKRSGSSYSIRIDPLTGGVSIRVASP